MQKEREVSLEKVKIKKIGVLSLANLLAVGYVFLGFLMGLLFTLLSFLGVGGSGVTGLLFGSFAVIIFPIVYGILGWVSGVITAVLYNITAKITGGLELHA